MEEYDVIVDDMHESNEEFALTVNESTEREEQEAKFKFSANILWTVFFEVNKQAKTMKCKLCSKSLTFLKSANTTNANSHLNKKDSAHRDLVLSKMAEIADLKEWSDEKVKQFKDAIIKFAVRPGISLEALSSKEFYQVLKIANPNIPLPESPNTIKSWIIKKSTEISSQLKAEFQQVKGSLSSTIDVWTDAAMLHAYLGVTLHYVKDSKLFCRGIGVVELPGRHTAEQIKERLELKLNEFGLTTDDNYKIMTDNASPMIKAFPKCEVEDIENEEDEDSDSDFEQDEFDEENLEAGVNSLFGNDQTIIVYRYSCAAHNLQLCLFYGVKSTLLSSSAFKALLKLQASFSRSQQARKQLKDLGNLYKKFIPVRWGTWIDVVERYLKIKGNMTQVAINRGFTHLSSNENAILEEYLKVLKVFKEAIVLLEYEKQPTVSWVFVIIDSLKQFVEKAPKPNSEIQKLCKTLTTELNARFDDVLNDPLFVISTLIDPATSQKLTPLEEKKAKKELIKLISEHDEDLSDTTGIDTSTQSSTPIFSLQSLMDNRGTLQDTSSTHSIKALVNSYISEIRNNYNSILDKGFGSEKSLQIISSVCNNPRYSTIYKISNKVLAVPSTGAPVERLFSTTGMYTRGNLSNIKSELLNAKLIVYKYK